MYIRCLVFKKKYEAVCNQSQLTAAKISFQGSKERNEQLTRATRMSHSVLNIYYPATVPETV